MKRKNKKKTIGQVRVRRDEHHQAQPEDRRHRGETKEEVEN